MSVEVSKDEEVIFQGDGLNYTWTKFYEEYGKDHYYQGPEYDEQAEDGVVVIKVYNTNNQGKYSLATGKLEEFTTFDYIKAFFQTIYLDIWFFR